MLCFQAARPKKILVKKFRVDSLIGGPNFGSSAGQPRISVCPAMKTDNEVKDFFRGEAWKGEQPLLEDQP